MLGLNPKGGLARTVARVPPLGKTLKKEPLAGRYEEKISTHCYHTVPNQEDYLEPIGESWSVDPDSAVSMFSPPIPTVAFDPEDFQDLSPYCLLPEDKSSVMVGVTRGSSGTVQDDELNTPDIGFQREFNFTSSKNVLLEDTSVCLEGWEIPSLVLPEISIAEEKSAETSKKEDIDILHTKSDGIYIDMGCDLTVGYEEEIVSQNQEVSENRDETFMIVSQIQNEKSMNKSVHNREEMGTSLNTETVYRVGNELVMNINFVNFQSVDDTTIPPKTSTSDFHNLRLESLLGAAHNDRIVTLVDSSKQPTTTLSLGSLLAESAKTSDTKSRENTQKSVNELVAVSGDSIQYLLGTDLTKEEQLNFIPVEDIPIDLPTKNSKSLANLAGSTDNGDGAKQPQSLHTEDTTQKKKKKMTLNLPPLLETAEINTPVLDKLLAGNGKFDLMSYVFDNNQALPLDSPDVKSFLSLISFDDMAAAGPSHAMAPPAKMPLEATAPPVKIEVDDNQNATTIEGIVVDLNGSSLDGQWNISQTNEMEVDDIEESVEIKFDPKPLEEQKKSLKGGKISRSRVGVPYRTELESKIQGGSSLKLKITKKIPDPSIQKHIFSKKKFSEQDKVSTSRPRGRPAKRQYPSTSKEENLSKSRQRKYSSSSSVFDEPVTPQSKRSRLSSVESECDRYRELRDRNNEASRKSRQSRKSRELEMKDIGTKLEKENQSLRIRAEEMERLVKKLRQELIETISKSKRK